MHVCTCIFMYFNIYTCKTFKQIFLKTLSYKIIKIFSKLTLSHIRNTYWLKQTRKNKNH